MLVAATAGVAAVNDGMHSLGGAGVVAATRVVAPRAGDRVGRVQAAAAGHQAVGVGSLRHTASGAPNLELQGRKDVTCAWLFTLYT